jgi:hypothetical protein
VRNSVLFVVVAAAAAAAAANWKLGRSECHLLSFLL